jgi:hypothetical protein
VQAMAPSCAVHPAAALPGVHAHPILTASAASMLLKGGGTGPSRVLGTPMVGCQAAKRQLSRLLRAAPQCGCFLLLASLRGSCRTAG